MAEFASKGVAGTALGLGAGALGLEVLRNGVGGLFGNGCANGNGYCHESTPVNRYEAEMAARIASLETEVKLRDANTYTDQKILETYKDLNGRINYVEAQISQQAVHNATVTSTIGCMAQQIAQLQGLTKIVIPTTSICPEPMARYNSWVAPTAEAPAAG